MAVAGNRVTVGTSATRLDAVEADRASGSSILIHNRGTASVFLGGSTVTTSAGYELEAGVPITIDLGIGNNIYGIVASGTVVCHVLQVGI